MKTVLLLQTLGDLMRGGAHAIADHQARQNERPARQPARQPARKTSSSTAGGCKPCQARGDVHRRLQEVRKYG